MRHSSCRLVIAALFLVLAGCGTQGDQRWYKGNLHTHSLWSDGDDFPEVIATWYRDHGYHFLAISDHNVVLEGERWIDTAAIKKRSAMPGLKRYLDEKRWRADTRGEGDALQVRLKTLEEFRPNLERAGRFLMIPSEEISATAGKSPIHMNATNLAELIKPRNGSTARQVIADNLRAIQEQAERLNRPILPHVNHPNFHYAITAEDLAAVVEERFFEVYNGHPGVDHRGDGQHPSVERIWDIANTIRLAHLKAAPLMGIACDDSHNYHRSGLNSAAPGRGWIMVQGGKLTAESLIEAMERGDFYASSGVTLGKVAYDPTTRTLEVRIEADGPAQFTTQFIGTPRDIPGPAGSTTALTDDPRVGIVLATVPGRYARYQLTGNELYVRAVVTSSDPADVPVYEGQRKQAWTQPVGWESVTPAVP